MAHRHKSLLFAGALLLGAAALATAASIHETRARAFFASALSEAGVEETVYLNNTAYAVRGSGVHAGSTSVNGDEEAEALKIAYAKIAARHAPLFSLPGADTNALRTAASELNDVKAALALRQEDPSEAMLITTALYPTALIAALADAEEARLIFLQHGSREELEAYETAQRTTARLYRTSLAQFKNAFAAVVPSDIRNYAVPASIISRNATLEAVEQLAENAQRAERRLFARIACTHGMFSNCAAADLTLPDLAPQPESSLTEYQRSLADDIKRLLAKTPFSFDPEFGSRTVQLSQSACVANDTDGAPLFVVRNARTQDGMRRPVPTYVGNWYFLHVTPGSTYASLPYLESFARQHIEYVPLHPLVYYECPESARDQGRVLAVRDTAFFAAERQLSRLASGTDAAKLKNLEHRLMGTVVSERDARLYLQVALAAAPHSSAAHTAALELALRFSNDGAGLYPVLLDLLEAERSNMRAADSGVVIDFSALNLFFTRNALLAFYAGLPGYAPSFAPNTLAPERQPYALYSTLPTGTRREETLVQSLTLYHEQYEHYEER